MNSHPLAPESERYTPAAGYHWLTPLYDLGIAALTRESHWRKSFVRQIHPAPGDVIADIGCGTGTLLIELGRAAHEARLIGIDPDARALERAEAKAKRAGIPITLLQGFAHNAAVLLADHCVNKFVSSLAFHHMPITEKATALEAMYSALVRNGELHIADFGVQRSALMRLLFRLGVQILDGRETTEPNARGILLELMSGAGFCGVEETAVVPTPAGSISLYRALRIGDATEIIRSHKGDLA